jgi:hypothetical protein
MQKRRGVSRQIIRWTITTRATTRKGPMPKGAAGETRWAVLDCGHVRACDSSSRRMVLCERCDRIRRALRL